MSAREDALWQSKKATVRCQLKQCLAPPGACVLCLLTHTHTLLLLLRSGRPVQPARLEGLEAFEVDDSSVLFDVITSCRVVGGGAPKLGGWLLSADGDSVASFGECLKS